MYPVRIRKEKGSLAWLGFANSLCGRDMGTVILQVAELVPGDLLFWNDTYRGDWPSNTITHVGIYVGNGEIVHRPTMARPCERIRLAAYTAGVFRCGLRLFSPASGLTPPVAEANSKRVLKIVAHSGKLRMQLDGKWSDLDSLEINADYQS